jgi:hypothetical protein
VSRDAFTIRFFSDRIQISFAGRKPRNAWDRRVTGDLRMNDEQQSEPKISLVIGVLGTLVAIILDVLSLIPFVGDIEEIPGGVVLVLDIIFGMGNVVLITQGLAMVLKAIPIVQALPVWTIAWIVTWYVENHRSKLTTAVETVAELGSGDIAEGNGAASPESAKRSGVQGVAIRGEQVSGVGVESTEAESLEGHQDGEHENQRPSEKSTEPATAGPLGEAADGTDISENNRQAEEESRREGKEIDYEEMMESESEIPPEEELLNELFEWQKKQSQPPKEDEDNTDEGLRRQAA